MIFLLLSILFSTITVCLFKLFERKGVDTFEAIVVNYVCCSIVGNLLAPQAPVTREIWMTPWFGYALVLGLLFITIFNFIAQTAQKISVSASMVAAKLSVAVPVVVAIVLYHEPIGPGRIAGILLSMFAVYFISRSDGETPGGKHGLWYLPVVVFVGSGCIDTLLNFVEQHYIPPSDADTIVCTIFMVAALLGSARLVFLHARHRTYPAFKNITWGLVLGIPNYFSMFFLVKTLENFHGSYIFPLNNIGIVAASTLVAVLVFKERLSPANRVGFALAIVSILLISFT